MFLSLVHPSGDAHPGHPPALILAPAAARKEDHSHTETLPPVHTPNSQSHAVAVQIAWQGETSQNDTSCVLIHASALEILGILQLLRQCVRECLETHDRDFYFKLRLHNIVITFTKMLHCFKHPSSVNLF